MFKYLVYTPDSIIIYTPSTSQWILQCFFLVNPSAIIPRDKGGPAFHFGLFLLTNFRLLIYPS